MEGEFSCRDRGLTDVKSLQMNQPEWTWINNNNNNNNVNTICTVNVIIHLFHYSEDSCGFEHVFVGETKNGKKIMGLHNWVQFYLQEKHGHVDYKGFKARNNKKTVGVYTQLFPQCLIIYDFVPTFILFLRHHFPAWWGRPCPEASVQLERFSQTNRQLLHRRQSRVWGRSVHHRLPDVHCKDHICVGGGERIRARAGRLSSRQIHRLVLP